MQLLVSAFVRNQRFQLKIFRVRVALERLGIHNQYIIVNGRPDAILRSTTLAVHVAVFHMPYKTKITADGQNTYPPCSQ